MLAIPRPRPTNAQVRKARSPYKFPSRLRSTLQRTNDKLGAFPSLLPSEASLFPAPWLQLFTTIPGSVLRWQRAKSKVMSRHFTMLAYALAVFVQDKRYRNEQDAEEGEERAAPVDAEAGEHATRPSRQPVQTKHSLQELVRLEKGKVLTQ